MWNIRDFLGVATHFVIRQTGKACLKSEQRAPQLCKSFGERGQAHRRSPELHEDLGLPRVSYRRTDKSTNPSVPEKSFQTTRVARKTLLFHFFQNPVREVRRTDCAFADMKFIDVHRKKNTSGQAAGDRVRSPGRLSGTKRWCVGVWSERDAARASALSFSFPFRSSRIGPSSSDSGVHIHGLPHFQLNPLVYVYSLKPKATWCKIKLHNA